MKIDWLIIKRNMEGTASEEEAEIYRNWISEDNSRLQYIEKVRKNYSLKNKNVTDNDVKEHFADFEKRTHQSNRRIMLKRSISIAASVILLFGLTTYMYLNDNGTVTTSDNPDSVVAQIPDNNKKSFQRIADAVTLSTGSNSIYEIDDETIAEASISKEVKLSGNEISYQGVDAKNIEMHTLKVPKGKNWNVTLADGTKVFVNANSELRFPNAFVEGSPRVVYLKGEAYFDVTKNPKSQFVVKGENADIKVYGTKFNVNTYKEGIVETALIEGSVSVTLNNGSNETMIKPNQLAVVDTNKITISEVDASEIALWVEGIFVFNELPISEIMDKLTTWYDFEVKYANESVMKRIAYCKIPRTEKIQPILDALSRSGTIEYEIIDKVVHLK